MLTFFFVLSFLFILIIIYYYYYIKKRNKRNKNKEKREGKNRNDQNDKILVLLRTKFLYIDRSVISACDVLIHSLFYLHPYLMSARLLAARGLWQPKGCHGTLAHRHQALSLGNLPHKRLDGSESILTEQQIDEKADYQRQQKIQRSATPPCTVNTCLAEVAIHQQIEVIAFADGFSTLFAITENFSIILWRLKTRLMPDVSIE